MIYEIFIIQILVALAAAATELLPERYLQPQDFNHHPFTDVGVPIAAKKAPKLTHPYAILSAKRPREGREFPVPNAIIYPTPHASTVSKKFIETNEISKYDDPYINLPKNYAFSYIVKDQYSGDDFSHSQAHNGKATKGQYRVKLPDGRTQIVSYTADHKGYRADVQYENDSSAKYLPLFQTRQQIPETPAKLPEILPNTYHKLQKGHIPPIQPVEKSKVVFNVIGPETSNYIASPSTVAPAQFPQSGSLNLVESHHEKPTIASLYYTPQYSIKIIPTSLDSYQQPYLPSTPLPQYLSPQYVSSTPLYPVNQVSTTPAPKVYDHYPNYQTDSSTITSHQEAVIVTPRPVYNKAAEKSHSSSSILYKVL